MLFRAARHLSAFVAFVDAVTTDLHLSLQSEDHYGRYALEFKVLIHTSYSTVYRSGLA